MKITLHGPLLVGVGYYNCIEGSRSYKVCCISKKDSSLNQKSWAPDAPSVGSELGTTPGCKHRLLITVKAGLRGWSLEKTLQNDALGSQSQGQTRAHRGPFLTLRWQNLTIFAHKMSGLYRRVPAVSLSSPLLMEGLIPLILSVPQSFMMGAWKGEREIICHFSFWVF